MSSPLTWREAALLTRRDAEGEADPTPRCTCTPYPYGTGPEEDCPVHGREAEQACVECGVVDEWNFAVRHADGSVSWLCQEHGQDGLDGDEAL